MNEAVNRIIRDGWKGLATVDQSEADEVVAILKSVLEALEKAEAEAK